MQIKITSWDNCPINVYYKIDECLSSTRPDYEKMIELISIVCEVDEDEVWALPLPEVSAISKRLDWINSFDFDKERRFKKINIGGNKCSVVPDLYNFSVAQYVDFQTYWKQGREHKLAEMLSVFIIPEGKKYNQDYDMLEFQRLIGDNVPLTTAQSLCFFFLKSLASSIRALQIYLDWETGKMEKKMTPESRKKMETLRTEMRRLTRDFYGSL